VDISVTGVWQGGGEGGIQTYLLHMGVCRGNHQLESSLFPGLVTTWSRSYTRATNTGREGGLDLRGFLAIVNKKGGGDVWLQGQQRGKEVMLGGQHWGEGVKSGHRGNRCSTSYTVSHTQNAKNDCRMGPVCLRAETGENA
jgi:hypothetical protein